MDFDQYVAARYGRLVEHAVVLGSAEDEARTHVDRVLRDRRRQIRRAVDPDPLVREALERAITGAAPWRPPHALAVLGVVAVAVAAWGTWATQPPAEPVPSLFALDGARATHVLEAKGYHVELRGTDACEPRGLVLAAHPATGVPTGRGATVTVQTAVPSATSCHGQYADRSAAWQFVSFALGGHSPQFADPVVLMLDSDQPVTLARDEALDPSRWDTVFDLVGEAAHGPAATVTGMPALRVDSKVPPDAWCGVPRPPVVGDRPALRIELDRQTRNDEDVCPVTIDLYRTGDAIDSVVVYRARFTPGQVARRPMRS